MGLLESWGSGARTYLPTCEERVLVGDTDNEVYHRGGWLAQLALLGRHAGWGSMLVGAFLGVGTAVGMAVGWGVGMAVGMVGMAVGSTPPRKRIARPVGVSTSASVCIHFCIGVH